MDSAKAQTMRTDWLAVSCLVARAYLRSMLA
ncbi:hypothetical protein CUN21_01655 [Enterococcus faecalis]|nr:hypothetical protein [Enterococcus faecalis]EGO8459040.1 hypothetical protein [Enterococcus faecalis]EGO8623087.1 hypothetical protein [Enterococcus faecalis]EGO8800266.1 hypothetical protein [Enterococcus faecalis]EGO8895630.1 hypothetical protein [Enterococcus faecalis]